MIDARTGTVRFDDGFEVGSQTEVDDFLGRDPNVHAEDFGVVNEFRVISFSRVKLWGRCFSAVLRFKNGRLHFVELTLSDGLLSKLGYGATEKDIRSEKKVLTLLLERCFGLVPKDVSLGVDYFPFDWGLVSSCADLRSVMCNIVINYSWRKS